MADLLYGATTWLAGSRARLAWRLHTEGLVDRVYDVVRRDPGARVVVAVNVRHCHHVRDILKRRPGVEIVSVRDLCRA